MKNPLIVFALEEESQELFSGFNLLYTGVGKVNASYRLAQRLHKETPSIVINLGTAGSAVHPAGTVLHATRFIQRDMDVSPLGFEKWVTPFSGEPAILNYGQPVEGLPHAVCGTGDSFDISHNGEHYDIVDMEAYALARICRDERVPFLCLKYISDGANEDAPTDWSTALNNAAKALKASLDKVLKVNP